MILELIVAAEASALSASWIRRSRMRRQEILMSGSTSEINLPLLDQYLRQQTANMYYHLTEKHYNPWVKTRQDALDHAVQSATR
jgi:hypothetical protein